MVLPWIYNIPMRLYFILDVRGTVAVMDVSEDNAWLSWWRSMPGGDPMVEIVSHLTGEFGKWSRFLTGRWDLMSGRFEAGSPSQIRTETMLQASEFAARR